MRGIAFLTGNLWRTGTLALLIALGVLYVGYSHRGGVIEDMRNSIAIVKANLAVSNASINGLKASLAAQNAAVSALKDAGERRAASAEIALREAERANAGLRGDIARIGARKVKDCETGHEVMESGL